MSGSLSFIAAYHFTQVTGQKKKNPHVMVYVGILLTVEPPGIEPGSYAMLPGLLRAQFVHDLLL